jgi:hypothetical protein
MIVTGDRTIFDAGQTVTVVNEFEYLRALVTTKNDVRLEIQQRIQTKNRCFCGLRKHLRSSHLARQRKLTIYKTLVLT